MLPPRPSALPLLALLAAGLLPRATLASPLKVALTSCAAEQNALPASARVTFTEAYAQLIDNTKGVLGPTDETGSQLLRVDLLGTTGADIQGYSIDTQKLATLFTSLSILTEPFISSTSSLCYSLHTIPPQALPADDPAACVISEGPVGLNLTLPLKSRYPLSNIRTRVRIVDTALPNGNELSCVDIEISPYYPRDWPYELILWIPVGLVVAAWLLLWGARGWAGIRTGLQAERERVGQKNGSSMRILGTAIVSVVSGDVLVTSPMLLRFVTPSVRDIFAHIQFCSALAMIAVQWPDFVYPIAAQGAWASLIGNITLVQGSDPLSKRFDPLATGAYAPPSTYASTLADQTSPLYLDASAPNRLLNLAVEEPGMASYAYAAGLRKEDLFAMSATIFCLVCAALVLLSLLIWILHGVGEFVGQRLRSSGSAGGAGAGGRGSTHVSPNFFRRTLEADSDYKDEGSSGNARKSTLVTPAGTPALENGPLHHHETPTPPTAVRRQWWRYRIKGGIGAFYASSLQGNLVRLLLLFHFPLTIFSVYTFTISSSASIATVVLSALFFAVVCVGIPAYLSFRIATIPSAKLYEATRTLLSLGPLYNLYGEGSQLYASVLLGSSLAMGIVIGGGQKSGTTQAIILLVLEIAMALVTSIWLPWGEGASMGATSFVFCVLRIITLVLVLILSQAVDVGYPAIAWITYTILILQAFVFFLYILHLIIKAIELIVRLIIDVPFDTSVDRYDSGLVGALSNLSCCGNGLLRASGRRRRRRRRHHTSTATGGTRPTSAHVDRHSAVGGSSMQGMLDHSQRSSSAGGPLSPGATSALGMTTMGSGSERVSGYFPSQEQQQGGFIMSGWNPPLQYTGDVNSVAGYAGGYAGASSSQQQQPVSRGFSVIRGGRADYAQPYSVILPAVTSPSGEQPGSPTGVDVGGEGEDSRSGASSLDALMATASPGGPSGIQFPYQHQHQHSFAAPLLPPLAHDNNPNSRPRQHTRKKSETAIIENYQPSFVLGGGVSLQQQQRPSPPLPYSPVFGRPQEAAVYGFGSAPFEVPIDDDVESDDTHKAAAPRRHSWFGRSKANISDDDEDEGDDRRRFAGEDAQEVLRPLGPILGGGGLSNSSATGPSTSSSSSRWFGRKKGGRASDGDASRLAIPSSSSSTAAALAVHQSGLPSSGAMSAPPAPKSFTVHRPPRGQNAGLLAGSSRSADGHAGSSSTTSASTPVARVSEEAPPRPSFVVNRPRRVSSPHLVPLIDRSSSPPFSAPLNDENEEANTALTLNATTTSTPFIPTGPNRPIRRNSGSIGY